MCFASAWRRTACQIWRGVISPKCRCGDSREVPARSGTVAVLGVVRHRVGEEAFKLRLRAGCARLPGGAHPFRPFDSRLQLQSVERERTLATCCGAEILRGAGSGSSGAGLVRQCLQNGVNT